jgi:(p)ppGpp synthase/HD superfamily hydrolase
MYPTPTHQEQEMLANAIRIATEAHHGQYDRGGHPYILHALAVMFRVRSRGGDITAQCIAVTHDVREDNAAWTAERMLSEGMSQAVVDGQDLMSHGPDDDYYEYIEAMKGNIRVLMCKHADLEENLDPKRLKGLRDKDFARTQKYMKAYALIERLIHNYYTIEQFKKDHL